MGSLNSLLLQMPHQPIWIRRPLDFLPYHLHVGFLFPNVLCEKLELNVIFFASSNDYYKLLFDEKWSWRKWAGPKQYEDNKTKTLMMLPTDMVRFSLCCTHSFRN